MRSATRGSRVPTEATDLPVRGGGAPAPSPRVGFWAGIAAYLRATRLILSRPSLGSLLVMPGIATLILFVAFSVLAFFFVDDLMAAWWPDASSWIAWTLAAVVLALTWLFGFAVIGGLVAAPFCDLMSQRIEAIEGILPDNPSSFVLETWSALKHTIVRLIVYVFFVALFLPTLLIPGFGTIIFATLMTILSIRYLAWDGIDYSLARRHYRFGQKRQFLRHFSGATLAYGSVAFVLMLIPFANLFVLPLNAASGTVLFCAIERQRRG